jgi:prepilin peptidase CpaA
MLFHYALFAIFPVALAYAAASDLLTMTLSNKLTLFMVAAFVVLAPLAGMDLETAGRSAAGAGIVLAIGFACFAFGWIGGGDAKLAAAITLWIGWEHALEFVGLSAILGGILTFAILSFRRAPLPAFVFRQPWVQRLHDAEAGVPYGVALAAAGLATYPETIWMRLALG